MKKADVYIFDEITSHLDKQTGHSILECIQKFLHDKIIIYISHDTGVKQFADNVVNLQEYIDDSM